MNEKESVKSALQEAERLGLELTPALPELQVQVGKDPATGLTHLKSSWAGHTICPYSPSTEYQEPARIADLLYFEAPCPNCFSGSAINAKDAEGDDSMNLLLLLMGLSAHRRDIAALQEALATEDAEGLRRVVEVDQDAQWLIAGAGHARSRTSAVQPWETPFEKIAAEARLSFPVTRAAAASKSVRGSLVSRCRPKKKKATSSASPSGPRLLLWSGTRRDLRLELSPSELQVMLSWLFYESKEYTVVKSEGVVADYLEHATRTHPEVVHLDEDVTEIELDTALALWDHSSGPLGTLQGALTAARGIHAH